MQQEREKRDLEIELSEMNEIVDSQFMVLYPHLKDAQINLV